MADNQQTVRGDWVLASGSGEQHQRARILRRPVLAGDISVQEDEVPSEREVAELIDELEARALDEGEAGVASRFDVVDLRAAATAIPKCGCGGCECPTSRSRTHAAGTTRSTQ